MTQLNVFLFGPPRCERDGQVLDIRPRKAMALLVYLTTTRQPHSRDALVTLFWPDSDQRKGRANLRRTFYRLNQALSDNIFEATSDTISLDPQADVWLDVETYQHYVHRYLPADYPVDKLAHDSFTGLAEAAACYSE